MPEILEDDYSVKQGNFKGQKMNYKATAMNKRVILQKTNLREEEVASKEDEYVTKFLYTENLSIGQNSNEQLFRVLDVASDCVTDIALDDIISAEQYSYLGIFDKIETYVCNEQWIVAKFVKKERTENKK